MQVTSTKAKQAIEKLKKRGFKNTEIASLLSRSTRSVSYYLRGERNIPLSMIVKIIKLGETSVEDICSQLTKKRQD